MLESIEQGSASEIVFVAQGISKNRDVPLAEVRLSSKAVALKLKKGLGERKKRDNNLHGRDERTVL